MSGSPFHCVYNLDCNTLLMTDWERFINLSLITYNCFSTVKISSLKLIFWTKIQNTVKDVDVINQMQELLKPDLHWSSNLIQLTWLVQTSIQVNVHIIMCYLNGRFKWTWIDENVWLYLIEITLEQQLLLFLQINIER